MLEKTGILYHYCTLETFLSIIRTKEVWLTDIAKSNDNMELCWLYHYLLAYDGSFVSVEPCDSIKATYIKCLQRREHEKLAKYLDETLLNVASRRILAICFSEESDLLSQWRGYANDGQGVAVGVNVEAINRFVVGQLQNIMFDKIEYDARSIKLVEWLKEFHQLTEDDVNEREKALGKLDLLKRYMFYKNPCFSEEKEWRLVYTDSNDEWQNQIDYTTKPVLGSRDYFCRNSNDLVAYRKLDFSSIPEFISNITIGPKCNLSCEEMKVILKNYGIKHSIQIKKSISSYR